jgi:hypothetical protein
MNRTLNTIFGPWSCIFIKSRRLNTCLATFLPSLSEEVFWFNIISSTIITPEIIMEDFLEDSVSDYDPTEAPDYEMDNTETIIVDSTPHSTPPMTHGGVVSTNHQGGTEATRQEEGERRAAELSSPEPTNYLYCHLKDKRVFVRNAAAIVSDILYTVRRLGIKEEEDAHAITPEVMEILLLHNSRNLT